LLIGGVASARRSISSRRLSLSAFSEDVLMAETDTRFELTEQMFAAVGRAITQWSFVENSLCNLFTVCIGTAVPLKRHDGIEYVDGWTAIRVFYAAEAFNTKRALVNAAIEAHLMAIPQRHHLSTEWAKLSDKARDLSAMRNKLAHWTVRPAQRTGTGAIHELMAPPRLMPPFGSPKYWGETGLNPPGKTLTTAQVGHIEKAFCLYDKKVHTFTVKLVRTQELLDKDAELAMRRLLHDPRLSPSALAELERVLASLE